MMSFYDVNVICVLSCFRVFFTFEVFFGFLRNTFTHRRNAFVSTLCVVATVFEYAVPSEHWGASIFCSDGCGNITKT